MSEVGEQGRGDTPWVIEPPIGVPEDGWARFRARVLDPSTAVVAPGEEPPRLTTYVSDTILVRFGGLEGEGRERLESELGLRLVPDPESEAERALLARIGPDVEGFREDWVYRYRLVRADQEDRRPMAPIDAWEVVEAYRAGAGQESGIAVALEHLVEATGIGGTPYTIPHGAGGTPYTIPHGAGGTPYTIPHSGNGLSGYAVPGSGGRQPVAWLGPPPVGRHLDDGVRRPVVAVLDTGVCAHPWLGPEYVIRDPAVDGLPLGLPPLVPDTEATGTADPLVGGIEPDAGHGTFIAGLVRQQCPDALVLAVRVFRGDGVVAEGDLIRSLQRLVLWQLAALTGDPERPCVDVLSLSLGYYHERPDDVAFDALLRAPLDMLRRLGVVVVASAGNDATTRPMFPAAFATPGGRGEAPLLAVGALNPDAATVALFSNEGHWVRYLRPGAGLVSTYPASVDTSLNAVATRDHDGYERSSIDPDRFWSGFAVWSGTSFAGPVLAGELAAAVLSAYEAGADAREVRAAVERARKVVGATPARKEKP